MKRKYILIFSIIILLSFIFVILSSINVNASSDSDINFTFENDVLFNQDNTEYYIDFNTREYEVYEHDGVFNATYSFPNDIIGEVPDGWDDYSGVGSTAIIIESLDGHEKVLELYDNSGATISHIRQTFVVGEQSSGIIEFWLRGNSYSDTNYIIGDGGSDNSIHFYTGYDSGFYCYDPGWTEFADFSINIWYHIKIEFDCSSDWQIWVDGVDKGSYGFEGTPIAMDLFETYSRDVHYTYKSYIDAFGLYQNINYTGVHFDTSGEHDYPQGITWDGDSFWIIDSTHPFDKVHKYYSNGTYTGIYFNITDQDNSPNAITWDGISFWITGHENNNAYKYYSNGTYTGTYFYLGAQDTSPEGLTWDGTSFWLVGNDNDEVYKYYSNGTYTGTHFDTGAQDTYPKGIIWDGYSFWVAGTTNNKIYGYNNNGIFIGVSHTTGISFQEGITYDGNYIWITSYTDYEVYKYKIPNNTYLSGDNLYDTIYLDDSGVEPDRWEFSHKGLNDRLDTGDDNPNGWTDLEDGGDDVNCMMKDSFDGIVDLNADSGQDLGLYRDNFGYSEDIALNVSFGFEIKYIYSVLNNLIYLKIFSSDNTEIVRIRICNEGELRYWTTGTTYVLLDTGFVIDTNYSVNLNVNYDTDICTLRYSTNGVFTDTFEFPLTVVSKTGLKKVSFNVHADTDYIRVYLDYIGIYVNYRSITTDFGSIGLHVSDHSYWYFTEHNLLHINIIGDDIAVYLDIADYVYASPNFIPKEILAPNDYNGLTFLNLYDYLYDDYWGYDYIWGGVLWFHFNETFEFIEVNIEGVKLTNGTNDYPLEFDYSGVDVIENYFYVLNNKLYFTQTSDDNNLEFIQATFDIENVLTGNHSVSYTSILTGNAQGHFRVSYTDATSTLLPLRTYVAAPNIILPKEKEVNELIILISDNDNDDIEGTTTGYITSIKLVYLVDVSITIITIALLSIMIPLLILIIPTFLIYLRLGKAAIVPTFVLMAVICFITNLIPLWLFFIILISSTVFMVSEKVIQKDSGE